MSLAVFGMPQAHGPELGTFQGRKLSKSIQKRNDTMNVTEEDEFDTIQSWFELIGWHLSLAKDRPFEEWSDRTSFGRLLYPGWFVFAGLAWISSGMLILTAAIIFGIYYLPSKLKEKLPPVYKKNSSQRST